MTTAPSPRPRRPFDFEAMLGAFVEHGVRDASMEQVAAAAGVSKRTLYHHFAGRDALFDAVVSACCDQFTTELWERYAEAEALPVDEAIRTVLGTFLGLARHRPALFAVLFRADVAGAGRAAAIVDEARARALQRVTELVRARLAAAGLPSGAVAEQLAAAMSGMAHGLARELGRRPDWSEPALLELATHVWLAALAGLDPAQLRAAEAATRA